MLWKLFLLYTCVALGTVQAGPIRNTSNLEDRAELQQEVNLLMFGFIQFSESLSYVYRTTEAKISKICQTLESQAGMLQKLGRQMETAADVGGLMKEVIQLLQDQTAEQSAKTKMTKELVSGVERKKEELSTKVKRMEIYLDHSVPPNIKKLKEQAEEHSEILRALQDLIEFHKEMIDSQDEQISKMEEMSASVLLSFSDSPLL